MMRAQRLRLSVLLALFPGIILGFEGCYFGDDRVPLGRNASDGGRASSNPESEPSAGATTAGEGGGADASDRSPGVVIDRVDVIVFQLGLTDVDLQVGAGGVAAP